MGTFEKPNNNIKVEHSSLCEGILSVLPNEEKNYVIRFVLLIQNCDNLYNHQFEKNEQNVSQYKYC